MRRKHYGRIHSVTLDLKEIANEFTARNERHTDTGWPKRSKPQNFVHIFAKYRPI